MAKSALQLLSERGGGVKTPLDLALDNYEAWYNASQALAQNKEYEIANGQNSRRKLTRADADEVFAMLKYWENEVSRLQGSSLNAPKVRPIWTKGNPCLS